MLQSDKHAYMGYLIPTISILKGKLEKRRQKPESCCRPLVNALLAGISKRFAGVMQCKKTIAAAILHPNFKTNWEADEGVKELGELWSPHFQELTNL